MPAIELKLPQLTSQDLDGTINFNASGISTIAASPSSFMIFYLAQEDEQNGYGTVIQLDEQHQAAIYPDLNPEYTYLFYKDEHGQLQTLLWCIEFATRNADGLYITQAKVHGRGVTEADMQRFNQIMVTPTTPATSASANPTHDLAEAYSPNPTLQPTPDPVVPTPPAAAIPAVQSTPTPTPPPLLPDLPNIPVTPTAEIAAPIPTPSPVEVAPPSQPQPLVQPQSSMQSQPAPVPAPAPTVEPITFPALPDLPTAVQPTPTPADDSMPEFDLPPLPPLTAPLPPVDQPSFQPSQPPRPVEPANNQSQVKNPVGRPPKPLMPETTWTVDQNDFAWAKAISRDPIANNQSELRQKIHNQIQRNQPELFTNPAFQPALDQAFTAICQAYDLAPTARQDLLKSLLNGRIVENLVKTLG